MEDVRRYVSITYLVLGAVVAWVLMRTVESTLGLFGPGADRYLFAGIQLSSFVGIGAGVALVVWAWRNERLYTWVNEVITELTRVTWPDAEDTRRSTTIVIGFALVLGGLLAVMDLLGKTVIDMIFRVFGS